MFQIVRIMLDNDGDVIVRRPLQPLSSFENTQWR
jgi:hypothetical protein